MIISYQLDFVYPSNKKDLDENESIKVKFIKICDWLRSAQLSAPFGVSFGANGVNPKRLIAQMVERLVRIQEVRGSIPLISTKNESTVKVLLFLAEIR